MTALSPGNRAVLVAAGSATVMLGLALMAVGAGGLDAARIGIAAILSLAAGACTWAGVTYAHACSSRGAAAAARRLSSAAHGDLHGAIPAAIAPHVSRAMTHLFEALAADRENIHQLAMFDPVTALPNRINFRQMCDEMLGRMPHRSAALFFIDLDRFKAVNDTMGHATGDHLLGMVAQRLRSVAQASIGRSHTPLLGRLAGDEFTVFVPDVETIENVGTIADVILRALMQPFPLAGQDVDIGASIGIAHYPRHGGTLAELMRAADAAMYHAKARGRGRIEHFSDALAAEAQGRERLEGELRQAIAADQFALVFQPQVALGSGEIVAVEALLRWRHPRDGVRLPGSFIGCAEESGLIVEIGEWVMDQVAETLARWGKAGIGQRLAINISQRQIDHASFFRKLRAAMHASGAPARLLELEISETLAMQCGADVLTAIAALRADGASIAIDDYGTGFTNLARLRDLPIDRVKLDRCVIEKVADNAEARTIAQAVISLIHGVGYEVVAEGVETDAQCKVLRVLGCDVVQGYAIAPPMTETALIDWAEAPRARLAG